MLSNNSGSVPDEEDLNYWADMGDMSTVAVLQVPEEAQSYLGDAYYMFETDLGIPTTAHIGPDMTLLSVDEYITNPGQFVE